MPAASLILIGGFLGSGNTALLRGCSGGHAGAHVVRLEAAETEADFFPPSMAMMETLHRDVRECGARVGHVKPLIESVARSL